MARDKRREELYVTVPSLFRCPISMDVMKSPVSLSTGVTYDRSSIERWLALGNKTCPATMQKLPSTHTTPNLTLRRLIHLWVEQAEHQSSQMSSPAITKREAADAIRGEMDAASIAKLIGFMKASEENLKFVCSSDDAVSKFVGVLAKSGEIGVCEAVVEVLDLIASETGIREKLRDLILTATRDGATDALSSMAVVLRKGSTQSKVRSARILQLIGANSDSQRKIAEAEGLLHALYNLTTAENDASAIDAGLSALSTISTSRQTKKELVRFGIVKSTTKILSGSNYSPPARPVVEKALAILAAVATCTEGRNAIAEDDDCAVEILKRLMKCSPSATEHGIAVLWSVCCLSRDCTSIERVAKVNGLTKVLLVMQSDCKASTRQMCVDLVKVLRAKTARSSLATYETRTTHITPY